MKIFIVLACAFAISIGLIFMPPVVLGTGTWEKEVIPETVFELGPQGGIIPGSYIVTLKPGYIGTASANDTNLSNDTLKRQEQRILIKADQVNQTLAEQGGNVTNVYDRAINGFAVVGVSDLTPLINDPTIQSIEPNTEKPLDAQYQSTGINRIGLNNAVTAAFRPDNRETKTNVDVAVVDTPVYPHPDLNLVGSVDFVPSPDAGLETHGTHVAGLCCARDNLGGVVGPAQGARIWSLHVCGGSTGLCSDSSRLGAFDWLISHASTIEVATMSCCGGGDETDATRNAMTNVINSGITYFRSAGNTGTACENDWGCDHPSAIVVGALSDSDGKCGGKGPADGSYRTGPNDEVIQALDDRIAPFSTYGSSIDIMSPGVQVLATLPGAAVATTISNSPHHEAYIGNSEQGKYGYMSGTSMATPLAAGVGALVKVANPSFTNAQVKSSLQSNGVSQTLGCDNASMGGLVSGANQKETSKLLWAKNY